MTRLSFWMRKSILWSRARIEEICMWSLWPTTRVLVRSKTTISKASYRTSRSKTIPSLTSWRNSIWINRNTTLGFKIRVMKASIKEIVSKMTMKRSNSSYLITTSARFIRAVKTFLTKWKMNNIYSKIWIRISLKTIIWIKFKKQAWRKANRLKIKN